MPRLAVNDLSIHVETFGTGQPLVLLHGFTGSTRTWDEQIEAFSQQHRIIAVDLPGHGRSDSPPDFERYTMPRITADLLAVLDTSSLQQIDLLGYSMGGRVALSFALDYPARVRRLILESASPGLTDPAERAARRKADDELAASMERDGLAAFMEKWLAQPLFAGLTKLPPDKREQLWAQRLDNTVVGLSGALRGLSPGRWPAVWDRLAGLQVPTLLIVGEQDRKYVEIGQRMAALLPRVQVEIVPQSGHTVHLEQPEAFTRAVLGWQQGRQAPYEP